MERSRRRIRMANTGKAEISGASGTILSYDTTSYRPTTQPATKSITQMLKSLLLGTMAAVLMFIMATFLIHNV